MKKLISIVVSFLFTSALVSAALLLLTGHLVIAHGVGLALLVSVIRGDFKPNVG